MRAERIDGAISIMLTCGVVVKRMVFNMGKVIDKIDGRLSRHRYHVAN